MGTIQKAEFSIFDSEYDIKNSEQYLLNIDVSFEHLNYAIFDTSSEKFISLESYPLHNVHLTEALLENIKAFYESIPALQVSYKKVNLIWCSHYNTLVPDDFYDETAKKQYFDFVHSSQDDSPVIANYLSCIHSQNIFNIPSSIHNKLTSYFRTAEITNHISILIEELHKICVNNPGVHIYIHLSKMHFDIIIFMHSKLIYSNTFEYKSSNDFIYYLLNVAEHTNIKPEHSEIVLLGEIMEDSRFVSLLRKYFSKINLISCENLHYYPDNFLNNVHYHRFYYLLNLML